MESFIIVLQVIASFLMIALILLQPSKGGSFFTASNQGVFGSSGGTTFLFRATMWCATFLAVTCIFLSWMRVKEAGESVVNELVPSSLPVNSSSAPGIPATGAPTSLAPVNSAPANTAPAAPAPAAPVAPVTAPAK